MESGAIESGGMGEWLKPAVLKTDSTHLSYKRFPANLLTGSQQTMLELQGEIVSGK